MKRFLLSLAFFFSFLGAAVAADLRITITHAGQTSGRQAVISGPHLLRMISAYRELYGQVQSGVDKEGKPVMRDRTDAEVIQAWADGIIAGTKANVKRVEQQRASKGASDGVDDIGVE